MNQSVEGTDLQGLMVARGAGAGSSWVAWPEAQQSRWARFLSPAAALPGPQAGGEGSWAWVCSHGVPGLPACSAPGLGHSGQEMQALSPCALVPQAPPLSLLLPTFALCVNPAVSSAWRGL